MATSQESPDDPQDKGQDNKAAPAFAPAKQVVAPASTSSPAGQPVDNSVVEAEQEDGPQQELVDADLPPEISPGAMGIPRITLVQALGFQADHAFDETVEDRLRQVDSSYNGTVTKDIWRKVIGHDGKFRDTAPSAS